MERITRRCLMQSAATLVPLVIGCSCDRSDWQTAAKSPATTQGAGPICIGQRDNFATDGVTASWAAKEKGGFFVVRRDRRIYAISSVCTHMGCVLDVAGNEFDCGCHGSQFTQAGMVLHGPAKRPLVRYGISVDDGDRLTVDKSVVFEMNQADDPGSYVFIY